MNLQSYNHKSYEAYETFGFIRLFFFAFDIVNIGLHFFLKDVRPMLPPVMNHSIAVA